jgi:hypothetical protein
MRKEEDAWLAHHLLPSKQGRRLIMVTVVKGKPYEHRIRRTIPWMIVSSSPAILLGRRCQWCQDRRSSGWSQKRPNWAASTGVELARLGRAREERSPSYLWNFFFSPSQVWNMCVTATLSFDMFASRASSPRVPCDLRPDRSSSLNLPPGLVTHVFRLLFITTKLRSSDMSLRSASGSCCVQNY